MLAAEKFIADRRDTSGSISENLLKINVYFKSKMTKMIDATETYQTVFVTSLCHASTVFPGLWVKLLECTWGSTVLVSRHLVYIDI